MAPSLETGDEAPGNASASASESAQENALYVNSVARAFHVLRTLGSADVPLGLTEVAKASGLGKSAAQRFLFTLSALGYVQQDPATKAFSITLQVLELAHGLIGPGQVREKAGEILRVAALQYGETFNFSVVDKTHVLYLVRYTGIHPVSVDLSVGSRLPMYCSAAGRALLAHMGEEEAAWILKRSDLRAFTPNTTTDPEAIAQGYAQTRQQGYFVNNEESFVGDISIAAPVFHRSGGLAGAVNIAVSTTRWSAERAEKKLAPVVVQVARQLSQALGWAGPAGAP